MDPPKAALTLAVGTTYANFLAKVAFMEVVANAVEEREQQGTLERGFRDETQADIYPVLKTYRAKIEAAFTADSAIVLSLPALKEESTATPEAGTLSGHWNAVTSEANLTGTPSPSASVVRHEIRVSLGPEADADDQSMKAEFQLADTIVFHTDSGLATPGALAHFRLVAVTADGHEKGTAWETIQRPL